MAWLGVRGKNPASIPTVLSSHFNCSGCSMDDGLEEGQGGLRSPGRWWLESSREMRSWTRAESAETMRTRWKREIFSKQEIGDGLDVVDEKDGVKDSSKFLSPMRQWLEMSITELSKRTRQEMIRIMVLDMKNLRCL